MDVVLPRNKETGSIRGFALVRMSSEKELFQAIQSLHGESFRGQKVLVQRARFGPELKRKHIGASNPKSKPIQAAQSFPSSKYQSGTSSFKEVLLRSLGVSNPDRAATRKVENGITKERGSKEAQSIQVDDVSIQINQDSYNNSKELRDSVVVMTKEGASISSVMIAPG
ncbi:uncharacterized protein LOC131235654 [Magnolia sinica]|uniref:uncharacterized protein LOC131235654 n=1 Tax=Magnolia sinica TaxID=86752 RepID=UPI002658D7F5|nr:uncharacterized protein LOC131235654 [Magnolia sinica]